MSATVLELPPEVLSQIIVLASWAAPTRQKRRLALLQLGQTCKAFHELCMRQIYSKLAYEISQKGVKLLATLERCEQYARHVRALAVREREGAAQRKYINSQAARDAQREAGKTLRGHKTAIDAIVAEEDRLASLFSVVGAHIIELKHETNLLPSERTAFKSLVNLQNLTVVPQVPFPDSAEHEVLLRTATFTHPLPCDVFLDAFTTWKHLRHLDLWRCSFDELQSKIDADNAPQFQLETLTLQECKLTSDTLTWLSQSSVDAESLRTLKLAFLKEAREGVFRLLEQAGPFLTTLSIFGDEEDLNEPPTDGEELTHTASSPFARLRKLDSLQLGGRGITSAHFLAIPPATFATLRALELDHTPSLSPVDVLNTLKNIPAASTNLKLVTLKGSEEIRRRSLRELLHPTETVSDWQWTRIDYVSFVSLMSARGVQYIADRAIVVGDEDASSDGEEFDMGEVDDAGEFFVTAEQWEEEKRIEREELERTWESGSEY